MSFDYNLNSTNDKCKDYFGQNCPRMDNVVLAHVLKGDNTFGDTNKKPLLRRASTPTPYRGDL